MIKVLSLLKGNWSIILLFGSVAAIAAYIYFQDRAINSLEQDLSVARANVAALSGAVATQRQTIETMDSQFRRTISETEEFNRRIADIREEQNDIRTQIDQYRGRLAELSIERPDLVERLANRAFTDVLREYRETTRRPE